MLRKNRRKGGSPSGESSSSYVSEQDQADSGKAIQHSSKSMRFPVRPGKGKLGRSCTVKANHFLAKIHEKDLHQYRVKITPELTSWVVNPTVENPEVTSKVLNCAVMDQLVSSYKISYLGGRFLAYDGGHILCTAGPLPFQSQKFQITLQDDGSGSQRSERTFRAEINFVALLDLHRLVLDLQGSPEDAPKEDLQVLDIVLRRMPPARYILSGRFFYDTLGTHHPLGEGLESWSGFRQSIRPTQMGLSLNIDTSNSTFIAPLTVVEFVTQLLKRDASSLPLSVADCNKIKKALSGVKVVVTHRVDCRRKYRIFDLTSQEAQNLTFPVDGIGTTKSIVDYYNETYGYAIKHKKWPCLQVGSQHKPYYLPMEVCKIVERQKNLKELNQKQIFAMLKIINKSPKDREKAILQTVMNAYDRNEHAIEFGIQISNQLASIEARVLPTPCLKYHKSGSQEYCLPRLGQWSMMHKKMVDGGMVEHWICINFSYEPNNIVEKFCIALADTCIAFGMTYSQKPVLAVHSAHPNQVEEVLRTQHHEAMKKLLPLGKDLDLLVVILPDEKGFLYGDLKRICETDIGLVSQCCLRKHVFERNNQYLANVALKINVKVGGRNTVLRDPISRHISSRSNKPTIIFGADVTHWAGEDSSPSIAAVVASQDWPEVSKYAALVSAQAPRVEIIQDLFKQWKDPKGGIVHGGMIREHIILFEKATGQKPERIIFYRDGVSDNQFYQVLEHELEAILKACGSLKQGYRPLVTFVVVQKRHHTRLFSNNHNDYNAVDKSGNILPGTVVDLEICHPTQFDFYLCSHAGIKGTSRPAHYHVLWDENGFTTDGLQSLTYNLCYLQARCTRSVSIVPPVHYAHLAAFRARYYKKSEALGSGEVAGRCGMSRDGAGGRSTQAPGVVVVRPLPELKENVKRGMFYC